MSIKIHLVFSFLIHSLILTYFLSLPIYKSSDALSFEGFFVYLKSEEGRVSGEPSPKGEGDSPGGRKEAANKIDSEIALIASRVRKEAGREAFKDEENKKSEPQREQVVEIIKHGVIKQKVFVAQVAPEEKHFFLEQRKGTAEPLEEEHPEADVPDGSYAQKAPEDTVEPSKEGVIVYEGTVLKTVPGFTIIPYEEASRVEILHARREEKTETKEKHEIEVLKKQEEPSKEEVEKEKIKEHVEVLEVRKDEKYEKLREEIESIKKEIYRGRGLLSEEATVTVSSHDEKPEEDLEIQREAKPDEEFFNGEEADITLPVEEHVTIKTVQTEVPPKIETGLLIESVQDWMVVPLENSLSGEPLHIEEEVEIVAKQAREIGISEGEEETQIEVQAQIETDTDTEKETETDSDTAAQTEKVKEAAETDISKVIHLHEGTEPTTLTEMDEGLLLETMPGTVTIPFESEPTGEAVYAEKRGFIEETGEQEFERYEEEKEPVQEFVEVEVPFNRLRVEEKLKYLESSMKGKKKKIPEKEIVTEEPEREMITDKISIPSEKPEERSVKKIVAPDIPEIDTGLLLTSVASETTVPFKEDIKMDLPEERSGDRDDKKESGDTEQKSLTEHTVKKLEIKKYLDLPPKEEDRKRELKNGIRDREQTADTVESREDTVSDMENNLSEAGVIPYEKDMELEESAEVRTPQEIDSEADEIPSEPLIERIVDRPVAVETERSGESHQEDIPQEVSATEDKESLVADVSISEKSRIPSQEKYASTFGEKKELMTAEIRPELQEGIGVGEEKPSFGISMPDVFFKKDIKIEISMNDPGTTEVSFQLMKKAHPLDEKGGSLNQEEIKLVEDTSIDYTLEYKRVFSTAKADKGIYIFVIKNSGSKGYEADVLFHIFEGKSGERKKEYNTIELLPKTTLKYKFIIPEAVFWDDEEYFTGTIESSKTLTKFNEKTGLIWKEEKDQ